MEAAAEEMRPDRTGLVRIALRARAGAGKTRSARELLKRLGVSERLSGTCRGEAFAPIGEMLGEKRAEAASEGLIEGVLGHLASLIPIPGIFAEHPFITIGAFAQNLWLWYRQRALRSSEDS